jgi:hypothetical protein
VVVVVATVVVVAAVLAGGLVVVDLGAPVVRGAVVAGLVAGGAVAAELGGSVGAAAASAGTVVVVVLGRGAVVTGGPRPPPARGRATAVVGVGHGRPWQPPGVPGPPNACRARTTTIPAVATPVATHGRRENQPPIPVPVRDERRPADSGLADSGLVEEKTPGDESAERGRAGG